MRAVGSIAALVTSACLSFASAAAAQAARPIAFSAPAECPDVATFDDLVRARVGYAALRVGSDGVDGRALLRVEVTTEGDRYVGSLRDRARDPQRVQAASCDAVVEALAMLVALAIDPVGEGEAPPRRGVPSPAALPADLRALDAERPPAPDEEAVVQRPPSSEPRPFGELQVLAHAGVAPTVSLGGALGVGLSWRSFELALEGAIEGTPIEATLQERAVRAWTWRAGLSPCFTHGILRACGSVAVGQFHVTSDVRATPSAGEAWVVYGAARVGVEGDAIGVDWSASLDAIVPILVPEVRFGDERVWAPPPIAGGLSLSARVGRVRAP